MTKHKVRTFMNADNARDDRVVRLRARAAAHGEQFMQAVFDYQAAEHPDAVHVHLDDSVYAVGEGGLYMTHEAVLSDERRRPVGRVWMMMHVPPDGDVAAAPVSIRWQPLPRWMAAAEAS